MMRTRNIMSLVPTTLAVILSVIATVYAYLYWTELVSFVTITWEAVGTNFGISTSDPEVSTHIPDTL